MTANELHQYFLRLGLSPADAAQLLSVSGRTVRRWLEGEEVPGPVEAAIRAWVRLHERHLPWRPDSTAIEFDDQEQIALHRGHAIGLDQALARVEERGGAKLPWTVDWDRGLATLGPMHIAFYQLASGSFSLASYRRTDGQADSVRDQEMIEDAIWCISEALKRKSPDFGPVVLAIHDGPTRGRAATQHLLPFLTAKAAIEHASQIDFQAQAPFIMTKSPSEVLWDKHELLREVIRRSTGPGILKRLAKYMRAHSSAFVEDGPHRLAIPQRARRCEEIAEVAGQIEILAAKAGDGLVQYQHFEEQLAMMHRLGFFPPNDMVGDVARALDGVVPRNTSLAS